MESKIFDNNDVDNETKQKFTDIVFLDKFAK